MSNNSKKVQDKAILTIVIQQKVMNGLSNDAIVNNPDFKVMWLFNVEYLRNGTRYRHSYIEILIGTYAILKSVNSNDLPIKRLISNTVRSTPPPWFPVLCNIIVISHQHDHRSHATKQIVTHRNSSSLLKTESAETGGMERSACASKWTNAILSSGKRFDPIRRYINARTYNTSVHNCDTNAHRPAGLCGRVFLHVHSFSVRKPKHVVSDLVFTSHSVV